MISIVTQESGLQYVNDKVAITLNMTDIVSGTYSRHLVYYLIDSTTSAQLSTESAYNPQEGVNFTLHLGEALYNLVYTPKPIFSQNFGVITDMTTMYKKVKVRFVEKTFDKVLCEVADTQTLDSNEITYVNLAKSYKSQYSELFNSNFEVLNPQSKIVKRSVGTGDFIYLHTTPNNTFNIFISYHDINGVFIGNSDSISFTATSPVLRVSVYDWLPPSDARYATITLGAVVPSGNPYSYTIEIYPRCEKSFDIMSLSQKGGYNYFSAKRIKNNYTQSSDEVFVNYVNGIGGSTLYNKDSTVEYDAEILFTKVDQNDVDVYEDFISSPKYFVAVTDRTGQNNIIEAVANSFDLDFTRGKLKFKVRHTMPYDRVNYHIN